MKKLIVLLLVLSGLIPFAFAPQEGQGVAIAPTFWDKLSAGKPYALVVQGAEKPSDWPACNTLEASKMLTTDFDSDSEYVIGMACPSNSMVILYYCYGNDCNNLRYVGTGYKINGVRPSFTGLYEQTFHFYKCYSCGTEQEEVCYLPDKANNYCIPVQMSNYDCLVEDGYPIKSECENYLAPLTKLYCLIGRSCWHWDGTLTACLGQGGSVYYDDPRCGASPVYNLPDDPNDPFEIPDSTLPDPADCAADEMWSPVAQACISKPTYYTVKCVEKQATCEVDDNGIYSLKACQNEAQEWNSQAKCGGEPIRTPDSSRFSTVFIALIIFGIVFFIWFVIMFIMALISK